MQQPASTIGASYPIAVGLGTNLGDRRGTLRIALDRLEAGGIVEAPRCSRIWASDAMLLPGAPPEWSLPFLNAVVVGRTRLDPEAVLDGLQRVEVELGRGPHERWAPRPIDLDLLVYGDRFIDSPRLSVPHPGIDDRPFVLLPLAELMPDTILPGRSRSLAVLADAYRQRFPGPMPYHTRPATEQAPLARGA